MTRNLIAFATLALLAFTPLGARAQGVAEGADNGSAKGSAQGRADAGPVGAVIGGVMGGIVGGVVGGVDGLLGVDQRPDFRDYVGRQHLPSDAYRANVREGDILPESGITYYDMPARYNIRGLRYAVVDNETVLVDPTTRRIVQVLN